MIKLKDFIGDLVQSWTKYCVQLHEIKSNKFSVACFTAYLSQFSSTTVKTCLLGGQMVTFQQFRAT